MLASTMKGTWFDPSLKLLFNSVVALSNIPVNLAMCNGEGTHTSKFIFKWKV